MEKGSEKGEFVAAQLPLGLADRVTMRGPAAAENRSQPVHRWVPWIAGFSGQFVADVLDRFITINGAHRPVLVDPFCGVGTTLVEGLRHGFDSVGFEINPYAVLASQVKTRATQMDLGALAIKISEYREWMRDFDAQLMSAGRLSSTSLKARPPAKFRSRIPFFSERVLWRVLATQDFISALRDESLRRIFLLAFGSVMVSFSNYSYEPSLGTRSAAGKALITDAPVAAILGGKLNQILEDSTVIQRNCQTGDGVPQVSIHEDSFFNVGRYLSKASVDLVVTSPPYLNNYHYVRNTRPQLWWLGLVDDTAQLHAMEQHSMGKFWQSVRDSEPIHLQVPIARIEAIVNEVRKSNTERGPYGGPGWSNYIATYFNDLNTFIGLVTEILRSGGQAVVVIGNSIVQGIEIKVDRLLSDVASLHGLSTEAIDLIRSKRVGSSIVDSEIRASGSRPKVVLYDAAVTLRKSGHSVQRHTAGFQ